MPDTYNPVIRPDQFTEQLLREAVPQTTVHIEADGTETFTSMTGECLNRDETAQIISRPLGELAAAATLEDIRKGLAKVAYGNNGVTRKLKWHDRGPDSPGLKQDARGLVSLLDREPARTVRVADVHVYSPILSLIYTQMRLSDMEPAAVRTFAREKADVHLNEVQAQLVKRLRREGSHGFGQKRATTVRDHLTLLSPEQKNTVQEALGRQFFVDFEATDTADNPRSIRILRSELPKGLRETSVVMTDIGDELADSADEMALAPRHRVSFVSHEVPFVARPTLSWQKDAAGNRKFVFGSSGLQLSREGFKFEQSSVVLAAAQLAVESGLTVDRQAGQLLGRDSDRWRPGGLPRLVAGIFPLLLARTDVQQTLFAANEAYFDALESSAAETKDA